MRVIIYVDIVQQYMCDLHAEFVHFYEGIDKTLRFMISAIDIFKELVHFCCC